MKAREAIQQTPEESRELTQSVHMDAIDWENQDEAIEFCVMKDRERRNEWIVSKAIRKALNRTNTRLDEARLTGETRADSYFATVLCEEVARLLRENRGAK